MRSAKKYIHEKEIECELECKLAQDFGMTNLATDTD